HRDYSEETAQTIDAAVQGIIQRALGDVEKILTDHRDQLERLADALVERETLDDDEIRALFGFPPRQPNNGSQAEGGTPV
ncbi:MAG: cell division protein FtsH, partial [Spirochaetaceae bacterium]|nr:cell division protein FtsH [Spirochaetaceae bacterium]